MTKRKICVVTGSRAEYGLFYWLMREIQADDALQLQLIVTGMHLSPEFGLTYRVIEDDGFIIDEKVEMLLSSDSSVGVAKSIGIAVMGFAEALARLSPDVLVLLGDRFETLAAAQAALVGKIPVAHIAGGDVTEGAFDEAIRHSITKMSHLHFVTNETAARRVRQMGENPDYVYNVGSMGIDNIRLMKVLSRAELEDKLKIKFRPVNLLITFHPATLDRQKASRQFTELLRALDLLDEACGLIFTRPNADPEGRRIIDMMEAYVANRTNAWAFASLGQHLYLNVINNVDAVVGNSSSGLYEAPSFKKPTVNIGDRQKGRLQAVSVLNCAPECGAILHTIKAALAKDCSDTVNPYGDGFSSMKIKNTLKQIVDFKQLLKKRFFEVF